MKIHFSLGWIQPAKVWNKSFKSSASLSLFDEYLKRLSHFCPSGAGGLLNLPRKSDGRKLWLCDTSRQARSLTSEEIARRLSQLLDSGTKELVIAIGESDGFTSEQAAALNPDLRWSFGPLTLPHELAAVVAAEQIYRAWTILRGLPYHTGH